MAKLGACEDARQTHASDSGWRQTVPSHYLCLHNTTARRHQPPEPMKAWGRAAWGAAGGESWTPGCRALLVFSAGKLLSAWIGHGMKGGAVLPPSSNVPSEHCSLGPELFMAFHAELQPSSSDGVGTVLCLSAEDSRGPCKQLSLTIPQRAGEELSPHFYLSGKRHRN